MTLGNTAVHHHTASPQIDALSGSSIVVFTHADYPVADQRRVNRKAILVGESREVLEAVQGIVVRPCRASLSCLDFLLDDTLPDADERGGLTPSCQCRLDTVKGQCSRLVQRLYDMHIVLEQLLQSHLPFKVGLTIHLALSMTVSLDDSGQFYHAAFLTNAEVVFPVVDGESHAQRELPINSPVWIPFVQTERYVTYADTLFKQHGRLFYLHCHFA